MLFPAQAILFAQTSSDFKRMFFQQLSATCKPELRWEKSVTDISAGTAKQTKVFEIDCLHGTKSFQGESSQLSKDEFKHLFEFVFDNPKQAEFLDVVRNGESLEAIVKSGKESKIDLHAQRFIVEGGKIREAEARILKSNALYDLEVHIKVWFDVTGEYLKHEVQTKTSALWGGDVEAHIEGRLLP